jgi:Tol biopolymer transport system component
MMQRCIPISEHVVYTLNGRFYSTDRFGKNTKELLAVSGNAYWLRWSPDRKHLRFTILDSSEATSIWEATADGRELHRVPLNRPGTSHPCCGSWTPDGRYFIFQVRANNTYHIWARQEQIGFFGSSSSDPVLLTSGPLNYRGPLLSRDGKRLFVRTENPKAELVRLDSLSGPYASIVAGISPRIAAFSRDGLWLAFGSLTDNNLWRCRADGTDCRQLTSGLQQCAMPSWSPEGRRIAFMARRFGQNWHVFIVSSDGDALEEMPLQGESNGDPDWSPNGNELIFGNVLDASAKISIYRYDFRTRVAEPLPNSTGMFSPRWSPDGKSVAAVHLDGRRLFLFQFSSGAWKPLTSSPGGYPNWSHDSKWVYFSGRRAVYSVDVRSGITTAAANLDGIQQGPWILGSWIGLAPDDCPLAIRNETTEKIYAWDFEMQ